jgi:hypothetical protein
MDLWRKIGVTIIFGIVAIIGGGLFWVLSWLSFSTRSKWLMRLLLRRSQGNTKVNGEQ